MARFCSASTGKFSLLLIHLSVNKKVNLGKVISMKAYGGNGDNIFTHS